MADLAASAEPAASAEQHQDVKLEVKVETLDNEASNIQLEVDEVDLGVKLEVNGEKLDNEISNIQLEDDEVNEVSIIQLGVDEVQKSKN